MNTSRPTEKLEAVVSVTAFVLSAEEVGLSYIIFLTALNSFLSITGTLGNGLVMGTLLLNKYLRSIPEMLIFSLSASDLIVSALYQPLNAYRFSNYDDFNPALSAARCFLGNMSLTASVSNIFCITVERLLAIRFALKYTVYATHKRAICAISSVWAISLTAGGAYARRSISYNILRTYFSVLLLGTVVMYAYILTIARKQENAVMELQIAAQNNARRRDRKAARTVAIVLGVALLCWLPLIVANALLDQSADPVKFVRIFQILKTLSICNSSINPYIYCIRNQRYRRALARFLGLRQASEVAPPLAITHNTFAPGNVETTAANSNE